MQFHGVIKESLPTAHHFTNLSVLGRKLFSLAVVVTSQKMVVVEEMQFFKAQGFLNHHVFFRVGPFLVALFLLFQFIA